MIEELKFVRGAVARKDYSPALTHFQIKDGKIKAFNGGIGLCSPISIDLDACPRGEQFTKVINACDETIAIHMHQNGKLVVRSGAFKAFVDCIPDESFPEVEPEGEVIKINEPLLPHIQKLAPFIGEDASRPWACGLLFNDESVFVTNNIILIEQWIGFKFPQKINIPSAAIHELLRIGEEPVSIQVSNKQITFHFENGRWLLSQLLVYEWPNVQEILDKIHNFENPVKFESYNAEFWCALEKIIPFLGDRNCCYFTENTVATSTGEEGASVNFKGPGANGIFNAKLLLTLQNVALDLAFTQYPKPVPFQGAGLRGIIVGMTK